MSQTQPTLEEQLAEMEQEALREYGSGDMYVLLERLAVLPQYYARCMGLLPALERNLNKARGAAAERVPSGSKVHVFRELIASYTADEQYWYARTEKLAKALNVQIEALRTLIASARAEMQMVGRDT